jgi:hypothetical protein
MRRLKKLGAILVVLSFAPGMLRGQETLGAGAGALDAAPFLAPALALSSFRLRADPGPPADPTTADGPSLFSLGTSRASLVELTPIAMGQAESPEEEHPPRYVAAKVGPLWFIDDLEDLDVGFNGELAFGYQFIRFLALEFQTGGFWGEDPDGNVEGELWGFPAIINLRASIPIAFLEPYAGFGIGGYYIHVEADAPGTTRKDDGFVFGFNLFAGLAVNLGRLFVLGELKYIGTTEVDRPDEDVSLEGVALMLGAGFRF